MRTLASFSASLVSRIPGPLRRFAARDDASLSVEAVLILPLLLWSFLAVYSFFDVYRIKALALKANYAISDVLSRETNVIDMNYIIGAERLYEYLTRSDDGAWLRVTVVHCTADCGESYRVLERDWSRATDNLETYSNDDIMAKLEPIIPWVAAGERVIIVETAMQYQPPFSQALTGVGPRILTDVVMTRPRFAPQLCFDGVGCGV